MSAYEDLLEMGYTDDQIEAIMALGGMQEESKIIGDEVGQAQQRSRFAPAQGRQAGQIYVAANPLEHLVTALRSYKGQQELEGLRGQQQDLLQKQQDARINFLRNQAGQTAPSPMGGIPYNRSGLRGV